MARLLYTLALPPVVARSGGHLNCLIKKKMGRSQPLFLYFHLFHLNVQLVDKISRSWDLNCGSLVSEATGLPTEPPPLPSQLPHNQEVIGSVPAIFANIFSSQEPAIPFCSVLLNSGKEFEDNKPS